MAVPTLKDLHGLSPAQINERFSPDELDEFEKRLENNAPGFLDRAAASMGSNAMQESRIYNERGFNTSVGPGGNVVYQSDVGNIPVDEENITFKDLGDMAGEAIPSLLSTLGGIGGAASPVPGGAAMGSVGGGMAGDAIRQNLAQSFGSGEDYNYMQTGIEGALGLGGEALGAGVGKLLKGPLSGAPKSPMFRESMKNVDQVDTALNTNMAGMAPIDSSTPSEYVAGTMQRLREDPVSATTIRDQQDIPFYNEVNRALDELEYQSGAAGRMGQQGPLGSSAGRVETGKLLRDAQQSTLRAREATATGKYNAWRDAADMGEQIDMTETTDALKFIGNTNVIERTGPGSDGVSALNELMEKAVAIPGFEGPGGLRALRQQVDDTVRQNAYDHSKISSGAQKHLKHLADALRRDEKNYMRAGGGDGAEGLGVAADSYQSALYDIDESPFVRRLFGASKEEKASDIPSLFRNATPEEVTAARRAVGVEGGKAGVEPTAEGIKAWSALMSEVFGDLRMNSILPDSDARGARMAGTEVFSGQMLLGELKRFKKGTLDVLLGPSVHSDLRQFGRAVKDLSATERTHRNFSGTARANSMLDDVKQLFMPGGDTTIALSSLIARTLGKFGMSKMATNQAGKRYLLGQGPLQQSPEILGAIGRGIGQGSIRGLAE